MVSGIEALFPGLSRNNYRVTSPRDAVYNCIAWAAGDTQAWWWPLGTDNIYGPEPAPREVTLEAFRAAFATLGYVDCESEEPETGCEKVALFVDVDGRPTHAARQLPSGRWTSKLGRSEDIEHALHDLEGRMYGAVVMLLKRPPSSDKL